MRAQSDGVAAISVLRSFAKTLYPNEPVTFRSDYPIDEAVKRLGEIVEPTIFHSLFKQSAVGRVRRNSVRLQRVIPFFGNSFKPIFNGEFKDTVDGVTLVGAFTTFTFSRIFMTVWFSFALIWTLIAIVSAGYVAIGGSSARRPSSPWEVLIFPVFGFLFIALGLVFLRFCWWLSRGDKDFLSKTIVRALTK